MIHQKPQGSLFTSCLVKIIGNVTFENNQSVPFANWIAIEECDSGGGFAHQFYFWIQAAEWTAFNNLVFLFVVSLIKVLVLIYFAILIRESDLVW